MVIGCTVSRTLDRRGCQHITPSKILSILLPIKVFRPRKGLNPLGWFVRLHSYHHGHCIYTCSINYIIYIV